MNFSRPTRILGVLSLAAGALVVGAGETSAQAVVRVTVSRAGITVSPTVEIVDGIVRGSLHASSDTGQSLRYEFLGASNGGKLTIGTVPTSTTATDPQSFTILPYATWLDGGVKGVETFRVRVSEKANATKSVIATIDVNVASLAPGTSPVAFTRKVESFDGVRISANVFPPSVRDAEKLPPLALIAPEFAKAGVTNPYSKIGDGQFVLGPATLRAAGYNVLTWDSRGSFASGGTFQMANPFFEGRDVSELISWAAQNLATRLNGTNDPAVGIIGANFGGAVPLATVDPRVDAIVPTAAWNSLATALNPNSVFKSRAVSKLLRGLTAAGVRLDKNLRDGLAQGVRTGRLSATTKALLIGRGPTSLLNQLQAPTLLIHDIVDSLVPPGESLENAQVLLDNPYGVPIKVIWFDSSQANSSAMIDRMTFDALTWLNVYVSEIYTRRAEDIANLQWWDQDGTYHSSNLYPFTRNFNSATPVRASLAAGTLQITKGVATPPTSVAVPVTLKVGSQVVGAPTLSFTYQGTGNARAVFARIVDVGTGKVLGMIDSVVPTTLDGKTHTVSVPLANIVYSSSNSSATRLEVQIRSAGIGFRRLSAGTISMTDIEVSVPVVTPTPS